MASLHPFEPILGLRKAKHLLRRTTFNFTKEQLELFSNMTATDAVNSIAINSKNELQEPYDPLPTSAPDGFWTSSGLHPNTFSGSSRKRIHITAWWWYNAMNQVSLKHKMSFFLHTCFSVGKDSGVGYPEFFFDHVRLLDFYALGNIKTLAKKITLDNGMLDYLDNTQNNKNNPNENYAREYLELYTILKGLQIGEGNYTNYTEKDIQQAAKVFSGFKKQYDRNGNIDSDTNLPVGYANVRQHDSKNKVFSSAFGNKIIIGRATASGMIAELDDFVEMVFEQPETAKAYTRKLYRYFVKSKWDDTIETDVIEPLAQILIANNYEILPVLKTLLTSKHFYDADDNNTKDNTIGAIIKSPLQLFSEICSIFKVTYPNPETSPLSYYRNFFLNFVHNTYFKAAGMDFYNPDSVAGYPAYYQEPSFDQIWFSSNTLIGRYKIIESLIIGRNTITSNANIYANLDTVLFVKDNISNPSNPNLLITEIADLLYPESIDEERIKYFKTFLVDEGFPDYYWTGTWTKYINDNDINTVKIRLDSLVIAMVNAAEFQLM